MKTIQNTPSKEIVLEVKNITKIYKVYTSNFDRLKEIFIKKSFHKEFISNKNISFKLHKGETLGIIGVNGAGKSTILKMIAGVTDPSSGTIYKKGKVTALLELGTGFNQELTGIENIYLNSTLIGMTKKQTEANFSQIIAFSELGEYIHQPIKTYSSGMKMRLAFSIALFSNPQILIVDEALSVGDAHFSAKCTKALKERKEKQHTSIIYVSHDLNSLKLLCDRVILLDKGKLIKDGNPQDVINTYNFLISKLNDKEDKITQSTKEEKSFGTFDIEIQSLTIKGEKSLTDTVSSGENVKIRLTLYSKIDTSDMTVGIHIQDKFGQNIFGTNTHHHQKTLHFKKNTTHFVDFDLQLNIGVGRYTIGAAVHTKDNHLENCAHWKDNACNFQVIGIEGAKFIGLAHLYPTITQIDQKEHNAN